MTMLGLVVDIDDTLVNTDMRRWAVWCNVLGREIPLEEVEKLGSQQILEKYAFGDKKIWEKYWTILLCWDKAGNEFLELNKPIPFASHVLQKWGEEYELVYLTARSRNMQDLTLNELHKFGFPTVDVDLVMLSREDWKNYLTSKTSHVELRTRLFSALSKRYKIAKVVDDYPIYFTIYEGFKVSERIGLLRPKRFSQKDYLTQGATNVTTWERLWNDTIMFK